MSMAEYLNERKKIGPRRNGSHSILEMYLRGKISKKTYEEYFSGKITVKEVYKRMKNGDNDAE